MGPFLTTLFKLIISLKPLSLYMVLFRGGAVATWMYEFVCWGGGTVLLLILDRERKIEYGWHQV